MFADLDSHGNAGESKLVLSWPNVHPNLLGDEPHNVGKKTKSGAEDHEIDSET